MKKDIMPGSQKRKNGEMTHSVPNTLTMAKYKRGIKPEVQNNLSGYFGTSQFGSPQNDKEEPSDLLMEPNFPQTLFGVSSSPGNLFN